MIDNSLNVYFQKNVIRIGWQTDSADKNLGSDFDGCGFDNNGIKYYGSFQKSYGDSFSVGDVIRCCIDLDKDYTISYYKNGYFMGVAYRIRNHFSG